MKKLFKISFTQDSVHRTKYIVASDFKTAIAAVEEHFSQTNPIRLLSCEDTGELVIS